MSKKKNMETKLEMRAAEILEYYIFVRLGHVQPAGDGWKRCQVL